jgi:hypothetical protein
LSFDWPSGDCLPVKGGVQFARGYGLSLAGKSIRGKLPVRALTVACPAGTR